MEKQLNLLTQEFASEIKRFEEILFKKKEFKDKQINLVEQFYPRMIVSNSISLKLVELIEIYDQLIAILKLLRLAGCFETDESYFANIRQKQKLTNQTLSRFFLS